MAADSLCIADHLCLYSEESFGYVYSIQSSSIHSEVAVYSRQNREKPEVPDPQVITFQIQVANRYKLNKMLRKLKQKSALNPEDLGLKTQISQAEVGAAAEEEDNAAEQKRQHGKKVLYGQIIQLRHNFSEKYVHISTTQTSRTETSNMQINLMTYNAKQAQFRIMPRYKVKAEGDIVQQDDQIVLESIKSAGQYLHVGAAHFGSNSVYQGSHELNLSVRQSGFTIYRRYKPERDHELIVKAGVPLRLFHKEIEAYLTCEGLFDDVVTEDVHLRLRPIDQNNPKTLYHSTSAINYWQFEFQDGVITGNVVKWEQQVRIRHLTTRKYLIIKGKKVTLTSDHNDPNTVFRLHPVIKERDEIGFDTYCRIEHRVTGTWLHAMTEEYKRQQFSDSHKDDMSMANLQWTTATLKQIGVSEEMQYDDAFTLQHIEKEDISNFNYMAGMVPFIHKIIKDKKAGQVIKAKDAYDVVCALKELKEFMLVDSVPYKKRQKLLRNLRIVEVLVQLLQIPYRGTADQSHMTRILVECYDVLYTYLMGDSRKNELYIAKHIEFFESQISFEGGNLSMRGRDDEMGEIGLNAAKMVMELVKDNRKIVDRITHSHIDMFVDLLQKNKNYRYLDLLSVLCVCDGIAIPDNQKYITETWLMSGKSCVYYTELGQAISKQKDVVYVSKDKKRTWIPLHEFVKKKKETDEEFLFLDHQLDLFGKLCHGRNEFAIKVITEELCYLTWDEAFICLSNENIPDQLRAKYCSLIIGLFVNVGENTSVLDRINLTFVYDDVGTDTHTADLDETARERSITKKYFPHLRDWISKFLDSNKDMTASLIGHNMLVEQVLRLVHYLVTYGYYGNLEDIKQLLGPLISLADGRNDKQYPLAAKSHDVSGVLERYRKEQRYKTSRETKAIVDAKHQAMEVLDLFFNFRFNTRLERFIAEFKTTHHKSSQALNPLDVLASGLALAPLLRADYDIYENPGVNHAAVKTLKAIFDESSYLSHFDLVNILVDLSNYEYDAMVVKSMSLLNRYYSAHDNLFKRAVQAQVLITDTSVQVLQALQEMLPTMLRLKSSKMTQEQTTTLGDILDKMFGYCCLENEVDERHPMNQSILYNHGVIGTVFDILSHEIDVKLIEQYSGMKTIFEKSFLLLKCMARGNEQVQQRLFDRIDMLLGIQGAEPSMAECLTEVFIGNKETCMKVLPYQVQRIMQLAALHGNKAPQFLEILDALVKVEELDLPLKRNQGYVMKYFMQYRSEVAYVIDQEPAKRNAVLTGGDSPDLDYLMALVDLLATCAEGENRFIESICQTIFSIKELLDILNDAHIDNNLKRPYLRFFLWVYLNTASGMIESGAGDLPHDRHMWNYLKSLIAEIQKLADYAKSSPETVKQLLKKAPNKSSDALDISSLMNQPDTLNSVLSEHGKGDWKSSHASLHYMFEAVLPFLQVFFKTYYQPDENAPEEANQVDELAQALVAFTDCVGDLISNQTYLKSLVSAMNVILSASTLPVKVMEDFQGKYSAGIKHTDIRSDARRKYDDHYQLEEDLNDKLNIFAINFSASYGGFNDVKTQIGYPCTDEYTELGGDEELPLGDEFQDHIHIFIQPLKKKPRDKYKLLSKLVQQLDISANATQLNEKDRLNQEQLDIKCLQLLRAAIHNEIVKLPDDWESEMKANRKALQRIEDVQNALDGYGTMLKILNHLSKNGDDIVREVLAFSAAMLFGGNEAVQASLVQYFLGTREEQFFFAIKNRMNLSAIATKEKRSLMAQHQAKIEEAIEQTKALAKAMKSGKMATAEIMAANQMGSRLITSRASVTGKRGKAKSSQALKARYGKGARMGSTISMSRSTLQLDVLSARPPSLAVPLKAGPRLDDGLKLNQVAPVDTPGIHIEDMDEKALEKEIEELAYQQMQESMDLEYRDDGYLQLVLKILGLMCDGQNGTLQDYLREQPDNIKSVNLVAETSRFLALVYSSINKNTMGLVTELFQTLVEFTSGNAANQLVVFDNKVCDYINHILRGAQFQGCSQREVIDLKMVIASVIMALIEENAPEVTHTEGTPQHKQSNIAQEVVDALDPESIWLVALDCYNKCQVSTTEAFLLQNPSLVDMKAPRPEQLKQAEEAREHLFSLGFRYFHILMRMIDLDGEKRIRRHKLMKTRECELAGAFYMEGTMSIEILKHEQLQKIYFRVKDKNVLREDVKEKFKYEVDRSTPSNKLREFMDWSVDIIKDIKYTRRVFANPLSRFFVKFWWHFNMAMLFLSFLFFILIMATWKANNTTDKNNTTTYSAVPDYTYERVPYITYALGGLHNFFTACVLISYFITNHPTPPRFKRLKVWCRKKIKSTHDEDDDEDDDERESHLEVKFLSFITFWYIVLFVASGLGTAFYGYCFSLHLLHMAMFNQLLKRAIQAVTKNGISLLLVFAYGVLFIYIYALIAFAFFREIHPSDSGLYCETGYQCFVTYLHHGLVIGTYEFLEVPEGKSFEFHLGKAIFDLTFFIIITTIGLNIIFGIIVDTFSELRDNKWQVDNDMHSTCFICSRNSYDFEHGGGGFEQHVKKEHNQWAYLFFFIHLDETRPNDYTALELYVHRMLKREVYDFFPLNRALSLQHEQDSSEIKLETLMTQVTFLVSKMKEDEAIKEREQEMQKQIEWEKQYKGKK